MGSVNLDNPTLTRLQTAFLNALTSAGAVPSATVRHGQKSNIGASGSGTALATAGSGLTLTQGLIIRMDPRNSDGNYIFVGTAGLSSSNGHILGPGDSVPIPANDVSLVRAVGSTSGLDLSWIGV